MRGAALKSAFMHLFVATVAWFGMPQLFDDPPIGERVIVVDMVDIADHRNLPNDIVKPQDEPEPKAEPTPPKPEPETAELAPPPPPPPAPAEQAPPPPPDMAEPKPAPEPEPEPEPVELAAPEPEPEPLPEPEPKPERAPEREPKPAQVAQLPKEISRPKRKPKAPDQSRVAFDKALQSLDEHELPPVIPVAETEAETPPPEEMVDPLEELLAAAESTFRPDTPLSMTEIDSIRTQIQRNWNVPAGAQDAHLMIVKLRIQLLPDGTVHRVEIVEKGRIESEPFFRSMAESAVRAVKRTHQINNLSPDKYHLWRDITVNFDPRDMFS
jgi:hypothetical protein